jgi:hypothetical protein
METPSEKTAIDEFMLAEYQTIASAHFDLHNGLRQNFRFYLGLIAVPSSVWAVAFKDQTDVWHLPNVLVLMVGVISALGFMMFVQMVHTRFDIILYTRVVNGVRAYFTARAEQAGVANLKQYLLLPTNTKAPSYRENLGRAYWWQFFMVAVVNSVFAGIFAQNQAHWGFWWVCALSILFHGACYYGFSVVRERKPILGDD